MAFGDADGSRRGGNGGGGELSFGGNAGCI